MNDKATSWYWNVPILARTLVELNTRYRLHRLPHMKFLQLAKSAGVKFSFGSNIHGLDVGKLDYAAEVIRALGLTKRNIFIPAPAGKKPIQIRSL